MDRVSATNLEADSIETAFGVSTGLGHIDEPERRPEAANLLVREYIQFMAVCAHAVL